MEQLIDKAAIIGEIDRRILDAPKDCYGHQRVWAYNDVKDLIKTIEAKEVDLEKEIQAFAKMDLYPIELSDTNLSIVVTKHQIYKCARHFFKLGLKAKEIEQNL